ncbi:PREDICTED: uncharacterized protein LOC105449625 isoform X2 [Wasmannia auropunctata]|uniref:uncharacterized protein LOC105449625 isoform X2 n=1 Tax=Wasmannia auropunctata TaxID=64793 RepID=UPI0005EDDAC1|nr:PREDICTED: uncharacterized protein LOC105449625 isoform X2 [Wasmannia auropunctata]
MSAVNLAEGRSARRDEESRTRRTAESSGKNRERRDGAQMIFSLPRIITNDSCTSSLVHSRAPGDPE